MTKRLLPVFLVLLSSAATALAGPWIVKPQAVFPSGGPASTNNDDTCDISVMPAATLLLPYFEVDVAALGGGETTIFTITNTTNLPQIAHITLWTDFSYPVVDFNVYLTGYDVQSLNLFDVVGLGRIAPNGTGLDVSPVGALSGDPPATDFDNPVANEATCVRLPTQMPSAYIARMQQAFTTGRVPAVGLGAACNTGGGSHTNATGYVTIDVAGVCSTSLPTDTSYFLSEIRFENVLIGDYLQVNPAQNFSQGNPMVHIRAIPEGGTPATRLGPAFSVNFPRTFYSRYESLAFQGIDARQPLPSLFAARWISGGAGGFNTTYKIWREGNTTSSTSCSAYPALGGALGITELVSFDEEENPETFAPDIVVSPPPSFEPRLPETSRTSVSDASVFPQNTSGDIAGWMYMNLDSANAAGNPPASQNWVIVSMAAEGRFSVDFDAAALGNGCTPETDQSNAVGGVVPIGPAANLTPDPGT